MSRINWKKSNFLISKKGNLIVVNTPNHTKEDVEFEGIILNAKESETNNELYSSKHFKRLKFELLNPEDVEVLLKDKTTLIEGTDWMDELID